MTDKYITGANWLHKKTGHTYCIICFSTLEEDHRLMVNYRRWDDMGAPIWCRPAADFFDGRFVRLFAGYKDGETK